MGSRQPRRYRSFFTGVKVEKVFTTKVTRSLRMYYRGRRVILRLSSLPGAMRMLVSVRGWWVGWVYCMV